MKMFIILLLGVCNLISAQENKTIKIVLNFSPLYGGGDIEIYNDSYQRLSSMMDKLLKSRKITIMTLSKETLPEGEYTISIYENGQIIQNYIVLNSENVYDTTNKRYLKCDVLSDVYRTFVHFLIRDRMNLNL
jgi:hypothetical protein